MKVTIYGSGYVGLVTGACLAEMGNHVLCVDVDKDKIEALKEGKMPIFEPGLKEMIVSNSKAGRIAFTIDPKEGVAHAVLQFIAVGTPPNEDGSADLQYVLAVAETIGSNMDNYKVVVNKSTVPVGTADKVRKNIENALRERGQSIKFAVVSNPEFLKEGGAIGDFMKPDRVIIGSDSKQALKYLRALYAPFGRTREKLIEMDIRSAELTKYAANAMLATKISFMNEIANIAERLGADIEHVRQGIGSDPRIGFHFIYPGCGYGGSCFPKDVQALEHSAKEIGYEASLLKAVEKVNKRQKSVLFEKIMAHFNGKLKGKTIALWGLAFKPNTDDMREAPSRSLMEALWQAGARVRAFDPQATEEVNRIYEERVGLELVNTQEDALSGADALVIVTEWNQFRSPDFELIKEKLSQPVLFDGRNIYDPDIVEDHGITYYAIGRGATA